MDFEKSSTALLPFYRLESESSYSNDETESVNSVQGKETDLARDTSDTEHQYDLEIEYEVGSESESDINSLINSSDESDVEEQIVLAAAAVICDSSFEKWVTDGEDSDFSSSEDNSFNRTDFWVCVKCKSQNNNPLFPCCEKCFQDRKMLFPPRPRPRKKKNKKSHSPVKLDTLRSCLSGLSQLSHDSGIGSSQECPPLELEKIVIPDHLSENSSKSTVEDEDIIPSSQQTDVAYTASTSKKTNLNDIVKSVRKRQLSESSLSDGEIKRSRWRDYKKSPNREKFPSENLRKRKSAGSDQDFPCKKRRSSIDRPDISTSSKTSQDCIDNKTSDLGSEISSGSGSFDKDSVVDKEMCLFCNVKPKNAIFLHGSIAHMCCCYRCAIKTWRTIKRCPLCNRKVSNVAKLCQP